MDKRNKIICMLEKIGLEADDTAVFRLLTFYEMLIEANEFMNLTAITDFDEVVEKHFADSLLLSQAVDLTQVLTLIDVGTGAGFPGIPLKIMFPELQVTLLDSLHKRVNFLEEVIERLDLKDIRAVHSRAEDHGRTYAYRQQYDLCVSRAVADLTVLCELCIPLVRVGGTFVSYKSSGAGDEIGKASYAISLLGGGDPVRKSVTLPVSGSERLLVCIPKISETPGKYPRKAGIPAKRPLS